MSVLYNLRRTLGYQKWFWFQGGRIQTRYTRHVARLQKRSARQLHLLDPIEVPAASDDVQIHLLCGHRQATMAVWGLWSFLRYAEGRFAVYVHSDGTLTPSDAHIFRRHFPGIHIIDRIASALRIGDVLSASEFTHLRRFRETHCFGPKLVDPHFHGQASHSLILDTDILFLDRPDELLDRCDAAIHDARITTAQEFAHPFYVADPDVLEARLGLRPAEPVNSGIVLIPRFTHHDFRLLDQLLAQFDPQWFQSHFTEQTLYALLAGAKGWFPLPFDSYLIHGSPVSPPPSPTAIHYVSGVRADFFTQGVPRLLATPLTPTPTPSQPAIALTS